MKTNYIKTRALITIILMACVNFSNAQKIAAGGWHSLVVCGDSTVKTFGENATGQLGNATSTDSNVPINPTGLNGVVAVSGGGDQLEAHSIALKSDGTVWTWGSNLYGGLGNGNTTNTNVPGQALVLTNIIGISAGGWHSVALKSDGTVWTWGWNTDGQLGDGTTTDKSAPAQVAGLTNITAIAAGTYHVLALKNDGTVWAWGDNVSGQIGNGTVVDQKTPVQVSGLSDVVKIVAGRFFSLAVKSDGTVWTWGQNLYGQLGDGTTVDKNTPVQISGFTAVLPAIVATGAFHCMAVKNDGTIWAWGRNTYGNLSDGTTTHRSSPVQVTGVTNVIGLAAGTNFSLLYKGDGTFWGCGRNASGQLCDGTFLQRNTVVQSTSLCPIQTSIKTISEAKFIETKAFPNPSLSGKFTLQFANTQTTKKNKIEVYNAIGKIIFQTEVNIQTTDTPINIDLSEQPNGIYFMTIVSEQNKFYQKLIKQ